MNDAEKIFTGERFVPGINDRKLEIEHLQRYMSVRELVRNKVVLDAACGEGYGSHILSKYANTVTGMDIDAESIDRARTKYADSHNLRYIQGSIEKLPLDDKSVDVVISFETIEHVDGNIQNSFLREISRVLKDDGVLAMSTPNKAVYSDLYNYHNKFHVKEFYYEEFKQFLEDYFPYVRFYCQEFQIVSLLSDGQKDESRVLMVDPQKKDVAIGKYYVAIASKRDIDGIDISSVYHGDIESYEGVIGRIVELQDDVEARNRHLANLDEEIKKKNSRIVELQSEEESRNNHIAYLDREIEHRDAVIKQKENIIKEKEEVIEKFKAEKENSKIDESDWSKEKTELIQAIRNNEGYIEQLLEVEREYEREKKSRTYRVAMFFRKVSCFLLPPGSRRRVIVSKIRSVTKGQQKKENIIKPVKKLEDYETIELPNIIENPTVSVIVPVYNEFDYTYNCIKSIIENSGDVTYEVIIANDCSTDITSSIDKIVKNVRLVTTEKNVRFLLNCNNAAKSAKGKYILFLNNDTQVQDNWLKPLVDLIESDSNIGMVGSKLVYPDGRLQEAGGILWRDGSAWNYGHLANPEDSEYNYVKEADYISGAAIMIRADLWNEIGGFDESFAPAYCEDSDLAFEVRKRGYKVMYQPLSVVVHFEGVSNGTDTSVGQKAYQVVNSKKFYEKWKDVLEKDHFPNAENVFIARERSFHKPVLLMVDHYVPQYDKDAGSRTVFQYLKLFVDKGFNVKFIGDNFYRHEPYTTVLQQMGVEVLYGPEYANHWEEWIKNNGAEIKYAFLNRPHISVKYIDVIRKYTNAKIIYYGHDLHFLREMRNYELTGNIESKKSSEEWKEKEIALMKKADEVYYPSYVEVEEIKKIDSSIKAKAIKAYIYPISPVKPYNAERRKDILFVGGFGHPPNADAVKWFVKEVFPRISQTIRDIKFYVLGSNPTDEIKQLASSNIIIKGFVSDEELESFYNNCLMDVVPLRYGAGIKGKVIEGMRFGIPVVTTSVGAEGIENAENVLAVYDEPEALANAVIRLHNDNSALEKMSQDEQSYISENYSEEAAWNVIREDFHS